MRLRLRTFVRLFKGKAAAVGWGKRPATVGWGKPATVGWGLLVVFLWAFVGPTAMAQSAPAIVYENWDVVIDLQADGDYLVTETQTLRFDDAFSSGFAEIPLEFTERLEIVSVADEAGPYTRGGDGPGTFSVSREGAFIYVDYAFPETQPGDTRTFIIQYRVQGGLAFYAAATRLDWELFPADRGGIPIEAASFTLNFPVAAEVTDVTFDSNIENVVIDQSDTGLTVSAPGPYADGTAWLAVVNFPPAVVTGTPPAWQKARDGLDLVYQFDAITVDLAILADGTLRINEKQQIVVIAGALSEGNRFFSRAQLDTITNVQVFEGAVVFGKDASADCYYCFTLAESERGPRWVFFDRSDYGLVFDEATAGQIDLNWYFPALVAGDRTEIELGYDVQGAFTISDDWQRLVWPVIPGYTVTSADIVVNLTLPPGVDAAAVVVEAEGATQTTNTDGTITLNRTAPVYSDEVWEVSLELPAGATSATPAQWQQDVMAALGDAQAARLEDEAAAQRLAQEQLAVGVGAILLGLGGLAAALLIWYLRGRDAPLTDLVAEYLTEPPSDLAPGLVAFLLDERPTPRGILANIFQLATLGLVQIDLTREGTTFPIKRNWPSPLEPGETIVTPAGAEVTVPDYLVTLYNNLEPDSEKWSNVLYLSSIWQHLKPLLPHIYYEICASGKGFFADQPEKVRHRWQVIGQIIALLGVIGLGAAWFWAWRLGPVLYWPPIAVIVTGLVLAGISRWMPRRSLAGSVEAARWRAFQRYLKDLQDRGDLPAAQKILEQHFAYTVALGLAEVALKSATVMGADIPSWTGPRTFEPWPIDGRQTTDDRPAAEKRVLRPKPGPTSAAFGGAEPFRPRATMAQAMQSISDRFSQQLNGASSQLTNILNSAIGDADDTPFELIVRGAGETAKFTWKAGTTTAKVLVDVMNEIDSSGGGGYSGGSGSSRGSRSSFSSSRSSFSGGRSSSSSRSSGGSRGFR